MVPTQDTSFIGLCLNSVMFKARLSAESGSLSGLSGTLSQGDNVEVQNMPQTVRSDGVSVGSSPAWMPTYEAGSAMGCITRTEPVAPWPSPSADLHGVGAAPLEARVVLNDGRYHGNYPGKESLSPFNGCLSGRLGSRIRGQNNKWHVGFTYAVCSHKLPRNQAVSLALKHFLPFLRGQHVLVRTDNTTVVAYINRQRGLRSFQMHTLAHRLTMWSSAHLLSPRATHVPGARNWSGLNVQGRPSLQGLETPQHGPASMTHCFPNGRIDLTIDASMGRIYALYFTPK